MMQQKNRIKLRIPANLKTFSKKSSGLLICVALLASSCKSGPIPRWDGKLYAGDSAREGVTRAQDPDPVTNFVSAKDPKFDTGLWMTYADFRSFYATYILGCKKWEPGVKMMTTEETLNRFHVVVLDLQREKEQK